MKQVSIFWAQLSIALGTQEMSAYYYTENDRKSQLAVLKLRLGELIPVARSETLPQAGTYEAALAETERLIAAGFTQEELTSLSEMVPDVVPRHRDWENQVLVQNAEGKWVFPSWFERLESRLQPALEAAGVLRIRGYY